ncbi:hypothetical protein [Halomicrococcus sp. NG-SE-24]|uniref:hypothetical protein n=1 Tax=Halomicrococcus sp. NG-SE-24 TaxID=3436928 RepID=UPI003D971C42
MAVQIGSLILGASISGVIGLDTVEYRLRRSKKKEIETWYERAIQLAEQVDSDIQFGIDTTPEDIEHMNLDQKQRKYRVLHDLLQRHISEAPPEIESEVILRVESLASHSYAIVEADSHAELITGTLLTNGAVIEVIEKARSAKEDAGWV